MDAKQMMDYLGLGAPVDSTSVSGIDYGTSVAQVRDIPTLNPDQVNTELGDDEFAANANLAQRMTNSKLSALRAQHPFLPILPFPNSVIQATLTANVAQDFDLPEGTKFIMIRGPSSTLALYASRNGQAQINATSSPVNNGSFLVDSNWLYYVEEVKQISLLSTSGIVATVACFQQL